LLLEKIKELNDENIKTFEKIYKNRDKIEKITAVINHK
jgi:hypothetical protein